MIDRIADSTQGQSVVVDPAEDPAAFFWNGCERGELWIQFCCGCANWQFYPRHLCSQCHSFDIVWRRASGEARLETYSVVYRAAGDFEGVTPYVVALVELVEGPVMMSNVVDVALNELIVGMALELCFEQRGGRMLPLFRGPSGE